uniref:Vesicle-fusing ATPase n=1 Tax=Hordeum vulgare subsp. vulgare TaxID=112509 RepID=F2DRG7_HORVV|nr:predicted protein [Hordeum vulgare subsp. vulgare]
MFGKRTEPSKPLPQPTPAGGPSSLPPRPTSATAGAPAEVKQTTPTGPFRLQVVSLPNTALAYTNKAYISSRSQHLLPRGTETFFLLNGKAVFQIGSHEAVGTGEIAMSGYQRDSFGFSQGADVSCEFFNPSAQDNFNAVAVTIKLEYMKNAACEVREDEMTAFIVERYANQVWQVDQAIALDFAGKLFKATVTELQNAPSKTDDSDDEKTHKRQSSQDFLVRASRAILTHSTIMSINAVKSKYLTFVPSAKAMRKNVLKPNWNFKDLGIGGLDDEFATIFRRAFASRLFPADVIEQLGLHHVKGILLYGPPGTGKTLIARQIGKLLESREPKVVNGPEVLNKYVGASEEAIRALFKDAEEDYKANGENADLHLIIFDEIDAICKARGSVRDSTGVQDTIVNQLLSKIDGVNSLNNILVIGMTNRKDLLDEALLRPGRLEVHVEISLPNKKGRKQIFEIHTRKMKESGRLDPEIDFDELAELTKNFSGAEIEGLVRAAVSHALYSHIDASKMGSGAIDASAADDIIVTMNEFRMALEEVKPSFGVSEDELKKHLRGELIPYSHSFQEIMNVGRQFIDQVRNNPNTNLLTVLLQGPVGCGKTAIAAQLGLDSQFPLVRVITPENYIGYSEASRVNMINKVFEDAYKSPLSIVILDNIERLVEYTPLGPRFSNTILQAILVLLKRAPSDDTRRIVVLATTSDVRVMRDLQVQEQFNFVLNVPLVENAEELKHVFQQKKVPIAESELEDVATSMTYPIPIKQLLTLIDMSNRNGQDVTADSFRECLQYLGIQHGKEKDRDDYKFD